MVRGPLRGSATRKQINGLLIEKLSDVLTLQQKRNFVMNALQDMRKDGSIRKVAGTHGVGSQWELHKPPPEPAT